LNNITIKDAYPLPNIEEIFPRLAKATYFTKLDLSSGYYYVELELASRKYTAFGSEFGFYEYTVMPMGLTNAPATFQRLMDNVLKECSEQKFTLAYLDAKVNFCNFPEALYRYERPATLKQLQSFIGLASYYRKYIKDFAKIASPLHAETTGKGKTVWSENCEQAFNKQY
jgi:hypothetical protein